MQTRNACTAATLSLVPGLGHIYIGDTTKGLLFLEAGLLNCFLLTVTVFTKDYAIAIKRLALEQGLVLNINIYEWLPYFSHVNSHACIIAALSLSFVCYAMSDSFALAQKLSQEQKQATDISISNGFNASSRSYRFTQILNAANSRLMETSSISYFVHAFLISSITLFSIFLAAPERSPLRCGDLFLEFNPQQYQTEENSSQSDKSRQTKPISATSLKNAEQVNQSKHDDKPSTQIKRIHSTVATPVETKTTAVNSPARTAESHPLSPVTSADEKNPRSSLLVKPDCDFDRTQDRLSPSPMPTLNLSPSTGKNAIPKPVSTPFISPVMQALPLVAQEWAQETPLLAPSSLKVRTSSPMPVEKSPDGALATAALPAVVPEQQFARTLIKPLAAQDGSNGETGYEISPVASPALNVIEEGKGMRNEDNGKTDANAKEISQNNGISAKYIGSKFGTEAERNLNIKIAETETGSITSLQPLEIGNTQKLTKSDLPSIQQLSLFGIESRAVPPNRVPNPIRPGWTAAQAFNFKLTEKLLPSKVEGSIVQDHPICPDYYYKTLDGYGSYMEYLQSQIKKHWFPPGDGKNTAMVTFKISADGTASKIQLSRSSGWAVTDKAAMDAIINAGKFRQLPENSPPTIDIEFTFDYNLFIKRNSKNESSD